MCVEINRGEGGHPIRKYTKTDITSETRNRWQGIFNSLGIDVGNGKHQACPACGGKDRFRFDDKDGTGTWICNQCGAGNGFELVMRVLDVDFKETIRRIEGVIGSTSVVMPAKKPTITEETLKKIYNGSKPMGDDDPVARYLRNRGLSVRSRMLRYHPSCYEPETKSNMPAMLAKFVLPDGKPVTIHRTFLTLDGNKAPITDPKKLLPALQKMSGGAIRLFEPEEGLIGIAEGIETALAVRELTKVPTWSAVSSVLMESFDPPEGVKHVIVFGDNDISYAGAKSAYVLANRLVVKRGLSVDVCVSRERDFLDDLNSRK